MCCKIWSPTSATSNTVEEDRSRSSNAFYTHQICLKTFTRRPHLQEHMILHTQDRPFKCSFCDEYFKSRFARLKHQEKYHLGESRTKLPSLQMKSQGQKTSLPFLQNNVVNRRHTMLLHTNAKLNKYQKFKKKCNMWEQQQGRLCSTEQKGGDHLIQCWRKHCAPSSNRSFGSKSTNMMCSPK